jgi:hypothetical protein
MEARLINGQSPELTAKQQDQILIDRSEALINGWNFPFAERVRNLVERIAVDCVEESLLPNAPLGQGANAVAIPQSEWVELLKEQGTLAQILHFASAYNAITIMPNYGQGGKDWCLIELGGPVILKHSLTLHRGGFLERQVTNLLLYSEVGS